MFRCSRKWGYTHPIPPDHGPVFGPPNAFKILHFEIYSFTTQLSEYIPITDILKRSYSRWPPIIFTFYRARDNGEFTLNLNQNFDEYSFKMLNKENKNYEQHIWKIYSKLESKPVIKFATEVSLNVNTVPLSSTLALFVEKLLKLVL